MWVGYFYVGYYIYIFMVLGCKMVLVRVFLKEFVVVFNYILVVSLEKEMQLSGLLFGQGLYMQWLKFGYRLVVVGLMVDRVVVFIGGRGNIGVVFFFRYYFKFYCLFQYILKKKGYIFFLFFFNNLVLDVKCLFFFKSYLNILGNGLY